MNGTEIIWSLIQDNFEQARSHEDYRARTVNLTLTIGSILVAALAIDGFTDKTIDLFGVAMSFQAIDGVCLIAVGLFGALISQKHYERNRMHIALAQDFMARLNESNSELLPFDTVKAFAEFKANGTWKAHWAEPVKLNWLWTGFPLILAIFGLLLLIGSFS